MLLSRRPLSFCPLKAVTGSHAAAIPRSQVGDIPLAGAYAVAWSPAGSYLQTFERPSRELGNAHKNLKVQRGQHVFRALPNCAA